MSIDWWTLGFQTVNVSVLMAMLGYFFWKPTAALIEKRRIAARDIAAAGERSRRDAAAAAAETERTRFGFAHEREEILAAAHASAMEARGTLLEKAGAEAAAVAAAATATAEADAAAATAAWGERSGRLAVEIAGRLAARLDGRTVDAAFLDWLLKEIAVLPMATRLAIANAVTPLEAVTAAPLATAEQERCRTLVGAAFGGHPSITFRADPSLIAGLELHGPHLVVASSWKADLDQVLRELVHDERR